MMTDYPRIYLVTAVITGLLFLLFIFLFYPPSFLRLKIIPSLRRGSIARVVLERLTGFLFFGVIPFLILYKTLPAFHGADLGIVLPSRSWFLPALVFWVLIVFLVSRVAGSPASLEQYPQMRQVTWTPAMVLLNALTWALYMAGYEFFFRGLLLFPLLPRIGLPATLALNLALYALAHLHKGWREVVGALLFGTVLVLATVYSGSLLPAFFSHLVLALSNSFFAARATRKIRSHG